MRSVFIKAGFIVWILLGCMYMPAYASATVHTACGNINPSKNQTFQTTNCLLTTAALKANIPPEIVKAIADRENGWKQFEKNGKASISADNGIGIMQITNQSGYDQTKLKNDILYNVQAGVNVLSKMYDRKDLPKIKGANRQVIENWYFPVMAYNGTKPANSPIYQKTGKTNKNAYQEKVFADLMDQDLISLAKIPFKKSDFIYQTNSSKNIVFKVKQYNVTQALHRSTYLFNKGNKVTTTSTVKLRSDYSTQSVGKQVPKSTVFVINGAYKYDKHSNSNQFVWYPVYTTNKKLKGYVASSYLTNWLASPNIKLVADNTHTVSGTVPQTAVSVTIKNGSKTLGTVKPKSGTYRLSIPLLKAQSKVSVYYNDKLNVKSPTKTITVQDKTAPKSLQVNIITSQTKNVTGTTEKDAIVRLYKGNKVIGKTKADKHGKFSIKMKRLKTNTVVKCTATDKYGNVRQSNAIKVKRS